jgi:Holliday junction resolvase RusA-like endonuclease
MTILDVWIPGTPEPQGSLKAFVIGGKARLTSTNKRLKSWRSDVCDAIAKAPIPDDRVSRYDGPVYVTLNFWFDRPKGHFGSRGNVLPSAPRGHVTRPDIDKLIRATLDAITLAQVWKDDSQVADIEAHKRFSANKLGPGTKILVTSAEEAPAECP